MGAKTAFAAAVAGDPRRLLTSGTPDASAAADLVSEWLGGEWVPSGGTTLDCGIYPQGDEVHALRLPGVDVLGAVPVLDWFEQPLPESVVRSVGERRLVVHQMHSVNDSLGFGVWESGKLARALGMDPDNGVFLDEGRPTPAEEPFWRGDHPYEDEQYPLPFHPLDLAEELLRAELGFVLEGRPGQDDIEPYDIPMFTFTAAPTARNRRRFFGRR